MEVFDVASSSLYGLSLTSPAPSRDGADPARLLAGGTWQAASFIRPPVDLQLVAPDGLQLLRLEIRDTNVTQFRVLMSVSALSQNIPPRLSLIAELKLEDEVLAPICIHTPAAPNKCRASCLLGKGPPRAIFRLLLLKIFRTRHSHPARLSGLKLWCAPSSLQLPKYQKLSACLAANTVLSQSPQQQQIEEDEQLHCLDAPEECDDSISQYPSAFSDSITFELMQTPMILPSGHKVDARTLEKCRLADTNRVPMDPFTGVPLITAPVLDVELKREIEKFISRQRLTRLSCPVIPTETIQQDVVSLGNSDSHSHLTTVSLAAHDLATVPISIPHLTSVQIATSSVPPTVTLLDRDTTHIGIESKMSRKYRKVNPDLTVIDTTLEPRISDVLTPNNTICKATLKQERQRLTLTASDLLTSALAKRRKLN